MSIKVIVISISTPLLIGIYKDNQLIETISKTGKTSDVLPVIFDDLLYRFNLKEIIYVNGPGSFMAIKVTYIFLKTLSIINNIVLKAIDGFSFNGNTPIKALSKKYFFKNKIGKIEMCSIEDIKENQAFKLPPNLYNHLFSKNILPNYCLPSVS